MSGAAFKFLVVADSSPEFASALAFTAQRVKAVGGSLAILRVAETILDNAQWVSVSEEMRAEAVEAAERFLERLAAEVWSETGVQAELIVREGDLKTELRRVIEQDPTIRLLVLGAGHGQSPGPLVSALARGGLGGRPVPVVIVPGGLSKEEARALAGPYADGGG